MLITQPLILHAICTNYAKRMDIRSNFVEVTECWRSEKKDIKLSDCIPSFPAAGASPSRGVCPISLPQCNGRVLKLEKSTSVGPTGNPWQSDGSTGFKERPPVLSGSCTVFPAKWNFIFSPPVKSADLAVLRAVPFLHGAAPEAGEGGVERFPLPCALGQHIPFPAVTAVVPERQSQQRALARALLTSWICQCQLQKPPTNQSKPGLLLPRAAPSTETSPGIIFSTGFRRGHSDLKKTSRSKMYSASAITFPPLCSQRGCSIGVSVIPWDLLPRRNQQCFWARAGTHPSCVWHLTNEAGLGEVHSWTAVSKFHCSLGSRNASPSGPRSFCAQRRAQSTKSSPLLSPRAARQEYEILHGTDVPFSFLGSLAKRGLYSKTIQWFPS